jgi:cystathionine beta-synthase
VKRFHGTDITCAIGETPIVRLNKLAAHVPSEIYAKLELTNPGGSIKDRVGVYMCRKAVETGELLPGGVIVEGTSGNTGVGVALFANVHGHPCIFVMADKQSCDKIAILKAYGARVVLCPSSVDRRDPRSYQSVASAIAERLGAVYLNQHSNPHNAETHYLQTGPEILRQTGGEFEVLIAGVGTGGTISGVGRFLKERMPGIKIVGVDARGSVLAEFHRSGRHQESRPYLLEGIGDGSIPGNVDFRVIDEFQVVGDEESFCMARALLRQEGIFAGGSSGAAVAAAICYAQRQTSPQRILVILPDSGNRYTSRIYNDVWMEEKGYAVVPTANDLDERIRETIGVDVRLV